MTSFVRFFARRLLTAAVFVLLSASSTTVMAQGYDFARFDLPGTWTFINGINNHGRFVGQCYWSCGFVSDGTTTSRLGDPLFIHGINDFEDLAGTLAPFEGPGFVISNGVMTTFREPSCNGGTNAYGINNFQEIVGMCLVLSSFSERKGFYRDAGGSFSAFDFPGAEVTWPKGINDVGAIAGSFVENSTEHGFYFDGVAFTVLDVPGAISTSAGGLNNVGQIVGSYQLDPDSSGAFLWDGSLFTFIDFPGATHTIASSINDGGTIVGYFRESAGNNYHGFIATPR